jgi:hypothetical protein
MSTKKKVVTKKALPKKEELIEYKLWEEPKAQLYFKLEYIDKNFLQWIVTKNNTNGSHSESVSYENDGIFFYIGYSDSDVMFEDDGITLATDINISFNTVKYSGSGDFNNVKITYDMVHKTISHVITNYRYKDKKKSEIADKTLINKDKNKIFKV